MQNKFWLKLILLVVGIAATVGVLPAWLGLASNVVINELDKLPVTPETFDSRVADVIRIVDGDTIEVVMVSDPHETELLRLLGVDTPETVHPSLPIQFFGPEATQFTKNMCLGVPVILHLQKDGPERGTYGRLLVYVELPDGKVLNEVIIENGFGYSYTKYPHEYTARYNALQLDAVNAKRGLWATVKFNDLPGWLRKSNPDVLK